MLSFHHTRPRRCPRNVTNHVNLQPSILPTSLIKPSKASSSSSQKDRSIVDDPWTTTTTIPKYTAHRRARADPTVWSKVCDAGQKAIHRRRKHNHLFLFTFYYHNTRSRSRSRFVSFRQVAVRGRCFFHDDGGSSQFAFARRRNRICQLELLPVAIPKPVVVGS